MTKATKRIMIGMFLGVALLTMGVYSFVQARTQAASDQETISGNLPEGRYPVKIDRDVAAKNIAKTFSVDENEVKEAIDSGRDFHDIGQAALLAKISGNSLNRIFSLKTQNNHWRDVEEDLGVSKKQMRSAMEEMMADRISYSGDIDKDRALSLLRNGYEERDICAAARLAQLSKRDVQDVLDMKKINNRWADVAEKLGVDPDNLHDIAGFPGHRMTEGEPAPMPHEGPPLGDED